MTIESYYFIVKYENGDAARGRFDSQVYDSAHLAFTRALELRKQGHRVGVHKRVGTDAYCMMGPDDEPPY